MTKLNLITKKEYHTDKKAWVCFHIAEGASAILVSELDGENMYICEDCYGKGPNWNGLKKKSHWKVLCESCIKRIGLIKN